MDSRPIVLVDLEATLDRHWLGSEPVVRAPIPALEPVRRTGRELDGRWRVHHWTAPERMIDSTVADALRPYQQRGALALMSGRPAALRGCMERRVATAGFAGVPIHHVLPGEHPAYGKRRIARAVRPLITIEDDLRIAEFLATYGYETILVDDRYNRGPIRSVNLMRIARVDLANVLALRLAPDAPEPETELEPVFAPI